MRQQAETARADADRIGANLARMVQLIDEAGASALQSAQSAEVTHTRIEASQKLVKQLMESGDHLEDFTNRNREVLESLRQESRGVADASSAVASGTGAITGSIRDLTEVSRVVVGGIETILEGALHLDAVVQDIRDGADRLTVVSHSLEDNLLRMSHS